jgi:GST-like protein
MIQLYAMGSPNVVKIYIALEEMGLPYEVRPVDVFGGQQFSADFLALNPNAKVPVLHDPDGLGGPRTIFESGAILIYLAEKSGQFLPTAPAARYEVLQWLMVQMTGLGPMSGQLVHFIRFAPPGNDYARSRYATQVRRVYESLDARLARSAFLGGAAYSIADMATFPWTRLADMLLGGDRQNYPHVMRWNDAVAARPAVQRALAETEAVRARTTQFDKAQPDLVDRMMGRGKYALA